MPYLLLSILLLGSALTKLGAQSGTAIGYDFEQPELLARLPAVLKEISGLSHSDRPNELLAVQDEKGKVFRISTTTGRVVGATEFWKDGDYEGIELVGDDIWVVKSTGTLYRIRNIGTPGQEVTKFNGFLEKENDVEGLAYDAKAQRLLLVCKSHSLGTTEVRSVFSFDLNTRKFLPRPVFSIGRLAMSAYLAQCPKTRKHSKIVSFIDEKEKYELGPSAIAIHPITQQIFVASSPGKLIIVLSPNGKILHVRKLDKDYFPQPEGLLFAADGTLFISTEAKGGADARIYRLPYQPGFSGL
ncbi:MAG: SdiA-regulated domain-containing protein [Bacteroidota bacterium]